MTKRRLIRMVTICLLLFITLTPASASAAPLLRRGSRGPEVQRVQQALKEIGYFTYPRTTGFYGSITEAAVRRFQRDRGLLADGIVGRNTRSALYGSTHSMLMSGFSAAKAADNSKKGDLDWFSQVQYIWPRGTDALVTDVDTGRSFIVRRTYGTNHADVEPLTRADANVIRDIWGGWSWERRAVVVKIGDYILAGGMTAMPHAGVDSEPAGKYVANRSGGYGWGVNLDAVKGNGVSGHMDIHFKNSRTHGSNSINRAMQDAVRKAALYIERNY